MYRRGGAGYYAPPPGQYPYYQPPYQQGYPPGYMYQMQQPAAEPAEAPREGVLVRAVLALRDAKGQNDNGSTLTFSIRTPGTDASLADDPQAELAAGAEGDFNLPAGELAGGGKAWEAMFRTEIGKLAWLLRQRLSPRVLSGLAEGEVAIQRVVFESEVRAPPPGQAPGLATGLPPPQPRRGRYERTR